MMKLFRKIVVAAAGILCLAAAVTGVTVLASSIPTVKFTNASNNTPDLYITKTTQDQDGYAVETDEEFTFILKLDGELANKVEYRVYDSAGAEVFNYYHYGESTDPDLSYTKLTFITDKYGTFTLKAGQTARFEYVGTGVSYEVSEEAADGWIQIFPAGGSDATGTVDADGSSVEFINMISTSEDTLLYVYKTISFPDGYTAPETEDFSFSISIDGKLCINESYEIGDIETGLSEGTAYTDEDGVFTLKGGQMAIFTVEKDADYQVMELELPDGWRNTTTTHEGTTGTDGAVILVFNNATAAFAVSKKTQESTDGEELDEDEVYTFQLAKADRSVWAGATYYLYNTDGTPVYQEKTDDSGNVVTDEDGNAVYEIVTLTTDENGQFTLYANQTAIFYNIADGTNYSVYEVKGSAYTQVLPNASTGYTDKTVTYNVEVLPFVNEPTPEASLTVTKVLDVSSSGKVPNAEDSFTFCLTAYDEASKTYVPVYTVYSVSVGTSTATYYTGKEDGSFTLCANQTAVFERLSVGTTYRVTEDGSKLTTEYTLESVESVTASNAITYSDEDNSSVSPEDAGTVTLADTGASVTFTNKYTPKYVDLYLYKKNSLGSLITTDEAAFALYYDSKLTNRVLWKYDETGSKYEMWEERDDVSEQVKELSTHEDGYIYISGLQPGTYYLVETVAPAGYMLLTEPIRISITRSADANADGGFVVKINDVIYTAETKTSTASELEITGDEEEETIVLTIYNHTAFTMPITGSGITYGTLIAGLAIILAAIAAGLYQLRKKACAGVRKEEETA